ncbi:hypothetical protein D3C78_1388530 [compost metagenome]
MALKFIQDLAGLGIGMLHESGIDLHQAGLVALLLGAEAVPGGELRRARRQLGILGNEAEGLLALEGFFTVAVPARIELALVFVCPLCVDLVRAMDGAWSPVEEEGFGWGVALLIL